MNSIFKLLLLILLLPNYLYSDGKDIGISISNASANENSNTISFTISLTETPILPISVNYHTQNGSATAGSDYTEKSDYLLFGAGIASRTVSINLLDDTIYEGNENFYVQISTTASGYKVSGSGRGEGIIIDDEIKPMEVHADNQTIAEPDSGTHNMNFKIYLNQPAPAGGVTVSYHTSDDTAVKNDDYIETTDSVTIPEGSSYVYVPVPIVGDLLPEAQEQFYLNLTHTNVGALKTTRVIGYIYDSDAIRVDISSSDVQEGNSGDSNTIPFKIFLTKPYPLTTPLTINYQTQDGDSPSATAGLDYTATSGSVTFHQGDTQKIVYVSIIGDNDIEPDENLRMNISGSSYIIDNSSESEILNDDGSYPSLSFDSTDFSTLEGNSSSKNLNFTFTLDKPALAGTSFQYYTQNKTAKTSNNDYKKISKTTYNVPEGATTISIPVEIMGDTTIENDEYFYLKLKNEKKLNIRGHTAKGYILNDDGSFPKLSFNKTSYTTTEGNNGQHDINITLSLDQPALAGSYFKYYTSNSTAKTSDNDYIGISTTKHTFVGGETELIIPITIKGDTQVENDERFYFKIKNAKDLKFGATKKVSVYINNDDGNFPKASIEATQLSFPEGDLNNTQVAFSIKLDSPATEDGISVKYKTYDSSAKVIDNDYEQISPQTVTFNIGESEKTLYSVIYADTKVEPDEKYRIRLYSPYHLKLNYSKRQIYIHIKNDDQHSDDPFTCDNTMYISSSTKRTTGATGRMWLHKIDTTKSPFEFRVVEENGAAELYNATAYNPDDNYIYGLYHRELIQITKTGKINNLGTITGLPSLLDNRQLYAGAIYGGVYYVTGPGVAYDSVYKINLANNNVSTLTLSKNVSIQDFSFSPTGTYLYGVEDGGKLLKIDVATGEVTSIGEAHHGFQFDSSYSDINGRFFANDSNGHGFFEFDLSTGNMRFLSNSQPATYNDGANCINAPLVFNDYGDAPKSYGKARHDIANGVFLGNDVDHDIKPYYSVDAKGDDSNGTDDEDGVTLTDGGDLNGVYFPLNTLQELKIKASKAGYLNVWLDYNINGVFNSGEKIIDAQPLTAGEQTISFTVPNGLVVNKTTYMRFRFSSTPTLNATENATDGEVEDYAVKFGSAFTPLRGTFNIERTNSGAYAIGSDQRNAWYTQIVGRDFDYSILFYDESFSKPQEIDNVTIKIELVDTQSNQTLYERYAHIQNKPPVNRIDIVSGVNASIDDLATLPASKDVHFRISYGVDDSGAIIQADCVGNPKTCFDSFPKTRTDLAQDNFAIRPEQFNVRIADRDTVLSTTPSPLRLAAGYDYNLTVIASQYNDATKRSPDYNASLPRVLKFIGSINCANQEDNVTTETFRDGQNISDRNSSLYNPFTFNNVGHYTLLRFIDKEWTKVDWNKATPDCIENNAKTSSNANLLSGCDITAPDDTNISFYPHHFAVNFAMNNLPNSGHNSLIYMSELNAGYNDVAIQFEGNITAQSEENITCTNFINGCMAEDVIVAPDAVVKSEDGINQLLRTSHQANLSPERANVSIRRMVRFNDDVNDTHFVSINYFTNGLTIPSSKFLVGDNNGSMSLDLRYNIDKHHSRTINPIQVSFNSIAINSIDAQSSANGIVDHYTPAGGQQFTNNLRNFYFTQVAPDSTIFSRVNVDVSPTIRTPLNVEIFCDKNSSYCDETNLTSYTNINSSPRRDEGWYLSTEHDSNHDGQVIQLDDTPDIVDIAPDENITFVHGRNGLVINTFTDCVPPFEKTVVTITPSPVLQYHPDPANNGLPTYEIPCEKNPSAWSGIGETGNIVETNTTTNTAGKIDW